MSIPLLVYHPTQIGSELILRNILVRFVFAWFFPLSTLQFLEVCFCRGRSIPTHPPPPPSPLTHTFFPSPTNSPPSCSISFYLQVLAGQEAEKVQIRLQFNGWIRLKQTNGFLFGWFKCGALEDLKCRLYIMDWIWVGICMDGIDDDIKSAF